MSKKWMVQILIAAISCPVWAGDWPTVHHDVSRSGYTADSPAQPFKKKWERIFCLENIDNAAEPIVADGKVFVATFAGNLYALDRNTGETKWKYEAGELIAGSPAFQNGTVFVGSLEGLHAVDAASGKEKWISPVKHGFQTSPCVANDTVFIGGRAGTFYAFDLASGKVKWKYDAGSFIQNSAAFANGNVVFADEGGVGHCLDAASGKEKWKTQSMFASEMKYYYPIIWQDKVVFLTRPAISPDLREMGYDMLGKVVGGETDSAVSGKWKRGKLKEDAPQEKIDAEKKIISDWLKEDPRRKSLWVFNLADGKEAFTAPILHTEGNAGVRCGAAVNPTGWLVTPSGSYWNRWCDKSWAAYPYCLVKLNLKTDALELLNYKSFHESAGYSHGNQFEYNEAFNFSIGGDRIYIAHSDLIFGLEETSRKAFSIFGKRDMIAGVYGGLEAESPIEVDGIKIARCPNEWHGTGRGAIAISGNNIFWSAGGIVQCFEGSVSK